MYKKKAPIDGNLNVALIMDKLALIIPSVARELEARERLKEYAD